MNWVKIIEGCEMPKDGDIVVVCDNHDGFQDWFECEFRKGKFHWTAADTAITSGEIFATHWAYVELPKDDSEVITPESIVREIAPYMRTFNHVELPEGE